MRLNRLVLFDIDGTLLWPDGAGRAAMQVALERVFGVTGPIDNYYFDGCTDRQAIRDLMLAAGLSLETIWSQYEDVSEAMTAELQRRIVEGLHNIRPCTGAPEIVAALAARDDVLVGLLTGNLPSTAHIKLRAAGYDPSLFRVGAYGSESADRTELPPLAIARAAELTGTRLTGKQVVIIGDTPADIACARAVGARSIAVLTGRHKRSDLEATCPDFIYDDLSDAASILAAILAP